MFLRSLCVLPIALVACIDEPRFGTSDELPSGGSATATNPYPGMVLVGGATLTDDGTIAPLDKGEDENKGKGKGGGKPPGDNDTPPPPPSTPSDPTPSTITVASFWIDALEVSADDYAACVARGACGQAGDGPGCTLASGLATHPINCVTFDEAARYCAFANKRLPTSDEWTVAAGGATRRTFPWGAEPPAAAYLNACGGECSSRAMYTDSDGFTSTAPRGSFARGATPDGIYDLAGNVAEWVSNATVRGGSFEDVAPASVAVRAPVTSVAKTASKAAIGFRCARDL